MTRFRSLAGAIALIAALSAGAEARVVLHAPRQGDILHGGTRATVSWSAVGLPRFVEEWEAFLSVDGGRYYAYRITPHLEADRREFTFDVPNVETDDARILIRAGDERREIELETSHTFAIRKDAARALAVPALEVADERRGEAARAGERGVVEWLDGDRDGSHLTPRSARQRPLALHGTPAVELHAGSVEESAVESSTAPRATASAAIFAGELSPIPAASRPRTGRDILLAYRRLNI